MFKIKKLFKLLGLSLSVSTLLSFLTPSTFASEKNNTIGEVTRSILHELIMSDPEQREWVQVHSPRSETRIVYTPPHVVRPRNMVNQTKHQLELKIEDAKRNLRNHTLSDNDKIYLSLILQSSYETAIYSTLNIKPLHRSPDIEAIMFMEHFRETKDEKINEYLTKHPDFPTPSKEIMDVINLCSRTLLYIYNTAHTWARQQQNFLFARYFANYILMTYLQKFVNDVCENHAFKISWSYARR